MARRPPARARMATRDAGSRQAGRELLSGPVRRRRRQPRHDRLQAPRQSLERTAVADPLHGSHYPFGRPVGVRRQEPRADLFQIAGHPHDLKGVPAPDSVANARAAAAAESQGRTASRPPASRQRSSRSPAWVMTSTSHSAARSDIAADNPAPTALKPRASRASWCESRVWVIASTSRLAIALGSRGASLGPIASSIVGRPLGRAGVGMRSLRSKSRPATRSAASDDIRRASVMASPSSGTSSASTKVASASDASSRNSSPSAPSETPIRAHVQRVRGFGHRLAEPGEHDLVEDRPPPRRAQANRRVDERCESVGHLLGRPRLLEGTLDDQAPNALLAAGKLARSHRATSSIRPIGPAACPRARSRPSARSRQRS